MMIYLIKFYTWIYYYTWKITGIQLRGLGFFQKMLTRERSLTFRTKKLHFSPEVKGGFGLLVIGKPNEEETHLLFGKILREKSSRFNFIDVGASVGEMIFGISIYENVDQIIAFEPRKECIDSLKKSIELNNENRIRIIPKAAGEAPGTVTFYSRSSGSASGIDSQTANDSGITVPVTTLDNELPAIMHNTILLIDVEGHEPKVLQGGLNFIRNNKPLIIFEYNNVSKKYFSIDDIKEILGREYLIFRLRHDGDLDEKLNDSWNCIALPENSIFAGLLRIVS